MEKQANTWYLIQQWLPALIFGGLALVMVGAQLAVGNYWILLVVGAAGLIFGWTWYRSMAEVERLLQAPVPQSLVAYFENKVRKAPLMEHKDAMLAHLKSLAYTLYGDFAAARAEMLPIGWAQKPPLVQAQYVFLQTLWAYLEQRDIAAGLSLARQARALTEVPATFPGAQMSLDAFDAAIEIGQMLAENSDPNLAVNLEKKLKRAPVLMKLWVAWGLEGYYRKTGQLEHAAEKRALLTKLAPHCKGLQPF